MPDKQTSPYIDLGRSSDEVSSGIKSDVLVIPPRDVEILIAPEVLGSRQPLGSIEVDCDGKEFYVPGQKVMTTSTTFSPGDITYLKLPQSYNGRIIIGKNFSRPSENSVDLLNLDLLKWNPMYGNPLKVFLFPPMGSLGLGGRTHADNDFSYLVGLPSPSLDDTDNILFIHQVSDQVQQLDLKKGINFVDDLSDFACEILAKEILGTNLIPVGATAHVYRSMLKDFGAQFYFKTIRGHPSVVFKGYPGLRNFLTSTYYRANNAKVVTLAVGGKGTGGAVIKAGVRATVISFIVVGVIDLVQWLLEDETTFADLVAQLGIDFSKIAISVLAALGMGAIITAAAVSFGLTVPVWGVIALGVVVGWGVGHLVDFIDRKFEISEHVKQGANNIQNYIEELWEKHVEYPLANLLIQLERSIKQLYYYPFPPPHH
jgi:hypothetical protein